MARFGKLSVMVLVTLIPLLFGLHVFGCDKVELEALLELKAAINYPNGTSLPDWTDLDQGGRPFDCCTDWDGVFCGESGRVTDLLLEGVRQVGDWYLNASLFLPFPHLQSLDLSYNSITGWTHHLRQLPSLKVLDLSANKLTGMIDVNGKLSNLSTLKELELEGMRFSDADTFMDSLSFFPSLYSLNLRGNNFTGLTQTSGRLSQYPNIQELYMSSALLEGQFPLWLKNLTSLKILDLRKNNLYGKLPSFLANLTALQYLDLSSNQFVGNVENSPLIRLTSLQELSLSRNNFQIPQTFRSFANHSSLELLWLDGNSVIHDNATNHPFVPKFQLSHLSLSNCNIVAKLPLFLLSQHKLTFLDLSNNYIEGNFPAWIVENNTLLDFVTLHNNSLGSLLHMSSQFHDHLIELDVSYNNINDRLPTNLSYLTTLRVLLLHDNNFSGMIPPSIISSSLRAIDLSNNHLGGQIPANICNLNFLNLANNSLIGYVPPCYNDSKLLYMFLNNNKLNGSLLTVLTKNTSLVILDLGSNQLSGVIPEWIGDLRNLSSLILSNNHLTSYIPTKICSLDQLSILDLSTNNLTGEIPICLSRRSFPSPKEKSTFVEEDTTMLMPKPHNYPLYDEYFYYYNQIISFRSINMELDITTKSHTYAYAGRVLDGMSVIDLSCNNLSGHIPPEIGRMTGVRGLNLSHNNLIGSIPSTFSKLSQIESLDLSYNNLSGTIPLELTQLNTLEVFSVAYNNLTGRIPDEKGQFGTFDESSYQGNRYLCGPPLLNDYCSTSAPKDHEVVEDVDGLFDMYVFYASFIVSSVIMFIGTLIVLCVNPRWRSVWFYYGEFCFTSVYYFVVNNTQKALRASVVVISKFINCF